MEHRKQPRKRVHQKVSLFKSGMLSSNTYTENYSDQGMYIRANGLLFPKGSELELLCTDTNNISTRIWARVVHRTLSGIGVRFEKKESEKQKAEQEELKQEKAG